MLRYHWSDWFLQPPGLSKPKLRLVPSVIGFLPNWT